MENINVNAKNNLNYSGTVKVGLMKNNKLFSVRKLKNEGKWPLFYFLSGCLAGDYTTINNYRPRYLQLFYADHAADADIPNLQTSTDFQQYFNKEKLVSLMPYPYTDAPHVDKQEVVNSNDAHGRSAITYKFMIPFTQLNIDASGNVNYLAIYSQAEVNTLEQPSVYVFIDDGNGKWGDLIDEDVSNMQNWNIYIEWTLEINNKGQSNN